LVVVVEGKGGRQQLLKKKKALAKLICIKAALFPLVLGELGK
jgi:hypothetical protein